MYGQNEKLERIANEMAMYFTDLATVCEKMTLELDNDMKQRNIDMRNNLLGNSYGLEDTIRCMYYYLKATYKHTRY